MTNQGTSQRLILGDEEEKRDRWMEREMEIERREEKRRVSLDDHKTNTLLGTAGQLEEHGGGDRAWETSLGGERRRRRGRREDGEEKRRKREGKDRVMKMKRRRENKPASPFL